MGQLEVDLPTLAEQRRIVDLIAALDDAIDAAYSAVVSQRVMRSAVTRASQSRGRMVRVADVATVAQGRTLPKAMQGEKSGSVPWYKIADMVAGPNVYGYSTADTMLTAEAITDAGGRIVSAGSVVFPRVGAAVLTEKKRILDVPGAVDENHLVLSASTGEEVLLGVFENLNLSDLVQTGAVPSLNMQLVRELRILWPEDSAVPKLNAVLKASRESLQAGARQLERLQALRAELLTALLSGTHEIPESYDEMMGLEPVGAMA